jgi:hypothetical protein
MTASIEKERLTIIEAAELANVSKSTIQRAVNGQLPNAPKLLATRLGTKVLIKRDTLNRWLDALES